MEKVTEYSELVDQVFSCPICHNNVMDNLVHIDDDTIKCTHCGTDYNPETGNRKIHLKSYLWYRLKNMS